MPDGQTFRLGKPRKLDGVTESDIFDCLMQDGDTPPLIMFRAVIGGQAFATELSADTSEDAAILRFMVSHIRANWTAGESLSTPAGHAVTFYRNPHFRERPAQ